ncbi:MAG: hypothetical protein MPJ50_16520 [Pirellulales bacterium]|nr:hypothetical protein [Pirellulales bacterium]
MSFVVLYHETLPGAARPSHWDLMIEDPAKAGSGGGDERTLWTWALAVSPLLSSEAANVEFADPHSESLLASMSQGLACIRLPDHRAAYLSYEGEIPGGRGKVTRIEGGKCRVLESTERNGQLTKITAHLYGTKLCGRLSLERKTLDPLTPIGIEVDPQKSLSQAHWRLTWNG